MNHTATTPEWSAMQPIVDLTLTSVGRSTLVTTLESFFARVTFAGSFRVLATVDPAYGVSEAETTDTVSYLQGLTSAFPSVEEVVVEHLPQQVGLGKALTILLAKATNDVGVHLEDDWEFTNDFNLDQIIESLVHHGAAEIVLTNSHVARDGTFDRLAEVEQVTDGLNRLTSNSWAFNYLPLCPHVHMRSTWVPFVIKALALTDDMACVDDRVRERVMIEGAARSLNVLWTRDILARDLGRPWTRQRGQYRTLTPGHQGFRWETKSSPTISEGNLRLTRSNEWRTKADALIPGTTQTYHKRPVNFAEGAYPVFLERGAGAMVWDVDGNSFIDYICALGAATLGHAHPIVTNTIHERVSRGVLLSLPTPAEVGAAESIAQAIPSVEMVRFLKTGAEACSAAIRLARHLSGRDRILMVGYHGWHDHLAVAGKGIPKPISDLAERLDLNCENDDERLLHNLEQHGHELAAILLSTPYHRQLPADLLRRVRAICDTTGTLLVLDEIVTGFRLAPGGLGQLHGVEGDILCFSKGMAAGMPIAAIAGKTVTMQPLAELGVSTTFGGELLSLEVLKQVQREYAGTTYYSHITELGQRFRLGINAAGASVCVGDIVVGYDPMPCLRFHTDATTHARLSEEFLAQMALRGVLLRRDVNFISWAHTANQIELTITAANDALTTMRNSGAFSEGNP